MGDEPAIQPYSPGEPRTGRARHRAFLAFGGGVAGVLLAHAIELDHPTLVYSLAIALAGASLVIPGTSGRAVLVLAIACIGAGRMGSALAPPADHLVHRLGALPIDDAGARRGLVSLEAVITHAPVDPDIGLSRYERGVFQGARTTMLGKALAIDRGDGLVPTRGRIRIRVSESIDDAPGITPGSVVRITGWMRPPREAMNPGPPRPPRAPVCNIDTDGWALVSEATLTKRSVESMLAPLRRVQHRLQSGARVVLGLDDPQAQTDPARSLLAALVLGQRDPGYDEAYEPFRRVGLAHLLAISGLHLAILAAAAAWVLRAIGPGWRVEAIGVAIAVGLLLVIVPARTPIVRAGVMVLALLAARALGRRHDPLAVLAWTALGIALWDPYQIFDLGYQLSFGLVAALLALAPNAHATIFGSREPIRGVLEKPPPTWTLGVRYAAGSVAQLFSATAMCWLVSLPWIAWRTGLLAPLTIPATIVMTPLVGLLLIAAYASLLIGTIVPPLAEPLSALLEWVANVNLAVVRWFDGLPYSSIEVPPMSAALAIAATLTLVAVVRAGRRLPWNHALAVVIVSVWTGVEVVRAWVQPPIPLQINTFAVGDGTAHLLRTKDKLVLWDCGALGPGAGRITAAASKALHEPLPPIAVLTHANLDHANGLPHAARELGITLMYTTPQVLEAAERGGAMGEIFDDLRSLGVQIVPISSIHGFRIRSCELTVLWPPPDARFDNANDASLVVRWDTEAGHSLLLTGDIGGEALAAMIDRTDPELLRVDVLELPHHGADDAPARRLVQLADARIVIQSAGTKRVRRDPWREQRTRGLWLVTGRDGAIEVISEYDGLHANTIRRGVVLEP
ncbi:MAG: ComEC/Rec2 family competence protein [Phycisphaerales bacterium]|nr:ComEC/Rec2 family competence protein [Phycisphaerales bacterium]